jgi:hypothetical protein
MTARLDRIFLHRQAMPAHFLAALRRAPRVHGDSALPSQPRLMANRHPGADSRPVCRGAAATDTIRSG